MIKINKKITILVVLILGLLFIENSVSAVTPPLSVEFQNNPLFEEANFLPGDSVTRWVKVTNNSGQAQRVLAQAINYPNPIPPGDLCHALMITISQNGVDLYGGSSATGPKTLCDFYQESNPAPIYLSNINNNETIQYDFTISFPLDKGNDWQEKTTYFDIVIGFEQEEGEDGDAGGGEAPGGGPAMLAMGGGGGGGGYSGLIIFNEENTRVETDRVILTWFTNYPATSRVIYDTVSHSTIGAPPNYGYAFSTPEDSNKVTFHRVILTGLTPGVTYYWRAISHRSPEAWSKELSFTIPVPGRPELPFSPAGPEGDTSEAGTIPPTDGQAGQQITESPSAFEEGQGIMERPRRETSIQPSQRKKGFQKRGFSTGFLLG